MADRFKAVCPCRCCEKTRTDRRTDRETDAEARGAQSVGHGGQRVSPQRFLPLGHVLNASLWHRQRWKRPVCSADEVRAEGDRALPDLPSAPLLSSHRGGTRGPRPPSVCLLCPGRKDKHPSHETDRTEARAPVGSVLWTLVSRRGSRDVDVTASAPGESLAMHARDRDEAPIILVALHYPETTAREGTGAIPRTLETIQRLMDLN